MPDPESPESLGADTTAIEAQVDRVLSSSIFRAAPTLSSVLKFITDRTLQGRTPEISEYTIATQVLGRGAEFDPSVDTIVRTQAYRLRAKLQQYYNGPGADDSLVIDVPKGHYLPIFRIERRDEVPIQPPLVPAPVAEPPAAQRRWVKVVAGVALVAGLCCASWLLGAGSARFHPASRPAPSPLVTSFWQGFLGADRQPVVSYSNHRFLGTARGTLVPLRSGAAADRGALFPGTASAASPDLQANSGPLYFQDDYTGVGEVLAATSLLSVLEYQVERVEVKRSHLVSTFDLQAHNVIMVGSTPDTNPMLGELPSPTKFVRVPPVRKWEGYIRNLSPEPGEASSYQMDRDPVSGVLRTDYAVVSVLPGIAPGKRILLLGGLTTSGTAAAAASVTEADGIAQLAKKLGVHDPQQPANWPANFESVWQVELSRGLDVVSYHVVAAKAFKPQR